MLNYGVLKDYINESGHRIQVIRKRSYRRCGACGSQARRREIVIRADRDTVICDCESCDSRITSWTRKGTLQVEVERERVTSQITRETITKNTYKPCIECGSQTRVHTITKHSEENPGREAVQAECGGCGIKGDRWTRRRDSI